MKIKLFIFIFIFGLGLEAHADLCETLLAEPRPSGFFALRAQNDSPSAQNDSDQTSPLITYLSRLLDETLIGDVHLVRFSEGLEQGQIINPISEVEASDFRLSVQRSGLEYLIQSGGFDPDMLLTWVREKLSERGVVRQQREVVHQDAVPFQPMEFQEIPAGEFWMGEGENKRKVVIPTPYELARFQLTQWQWAKVMGENPSHFIHGSESIEVEINGKKIRMQPNHPVEKISWNDIHDLFLPKLNSLSKADDPLIYEVIPDHIKGATYDFPTEVQWERTARAGTDTAFSFGDDEAELPKYAWFEKNSNRTTHAVGLKLPNAFGLFDMHGNVLEWMKDNSGSRRVLRGGGWFYAARDLRSAIRRNVGPDDHSSGVGFRLVRTNE